ncbi:histidinol-phosphate aminotransferase [Ophiocordyceps camponoti-floridani]|uniref:histidinol-phosphate transaminase n=1 Tax=Ophiocordyceps camponoti-floridani TaxID=2030778 RepID=A0A8H4Q5R5_9HYPO|nr:histidinol-phosphate aminotransferase [Ophiocordyceps camponoti-floridani]
MSPFRLESCVRPNILALKPYRCARDDYKDDGTNILLDANENAYGPSVSAPPGLGFDPRNLHRYPDPHQLDLKRQLCRLRNTGAHTDKPLTPEHIFVGVGSDEAIDVLLRCFCVPGRDHILTCPPTYGMYAVSAQVNDVGIIRVPLGPAPDFAVDVPSVTAALDDASSNIKVVYLCSPGNPTGSLLSTTQIDKILAHPTWNGIVVVDEAYIDFATAESASLAQLAPYNVSTPTAALASAALSEAGLSVMRLNRQRILDQRDRLLGELPLIPGIGRLRGGTDANFLLFEMLDAAGRPDNATALAVYEGLAQSERVVVRFRGSEHGCLGCLRITVGTEQEVTALLRSLRLRLAEVRKAAPAVGEEETAKEVAANGVVA